MAPTFMQVLEELGLSDQRWEDSYQKIPIYVHHISVDPILGQVTLFNKTRSAHVTVSVPRVRVYRQGRYLTETGAEATDKFIRQHAQRLAAYGYEES